MSQKLTVKVEHNRFPWKPRLRAYQNYTSSVCGRNWHNIDPSPEILQRYTATEDEFLWMLLMTWKVDGGLIRKYIDQLNYIVLHHASSGNLKDFVIDESDIRGHLKEELTTERIGGTPKQRDEIVCEIISNAVRRLFEELQPRFYREHLKGKISWKIQK
jgi:hypothetical protein